MWVDAFCQLHFPYLPVGAWREGLEVVMIARWLRRQLRRERASGDVARSAADPVWRPAVSFDPTVRPIAWWRAL